MKECPLCYRCYEDPANFCPIDGAGLLHSLEGHCRLAEKYRLERLLARGGMGAIYQATQEGLQRSVAIKVLNPELVNNSLALERFRREALAVAGLTHPHIVTIYDFGVTTTGNPFIVMEYLKGVSLSQTLAQQPRLTLQRTLEILEPICQALQEAHSKGIIHRDLKPDNIMLEYVGPREVVKVVDFGLAKFKLNSTQQHITGTLIVGTFNYMSPEQCQGLELDATTDIYSLGVMLYQMLTGQVPFVASSRLALIYQHINEPPLPLRQVFPKIPLAVEAVVLRALEKEPFDRQASAMALLAEFRQALAAPLHPLRSRPQQLPVERHHLHHTLKHHLAFEQFAGREQELQTLLATLKTISSGHTSPIIIFGEAGIGKTSLLAEFQRRLNNQPILLLASRFFDYFGSTPYRPLLDSLNQQLIYLQQDPALFAKIFGELAAHVAHNIQTNWTSWNIAPRTGSLQSIPAGEQFRAFEYLTQVYIKLARFQPIITVIDDLQWADDISLNFFSYLLRRAVNEPLQFIFTARLPDVLQTDHPVNAWLTTITAVRDPAKLFLTGLTVSEITPYLQTVFGELDVNPATVSQLWQETQGNPYFLAEILRLLVEQETITRTDTHWQIPQLQEINLPTTIVNIVTVHLHQFSAAILDVFMQAAVLGEQFSFETLQLITALPETALRHILEIGLAGDIFQPITQRQHLPFRHTDEVYSFSQKTVRKVLYNKLNPRRRRRLHQRIAESLKEAFPSPPATRLASLIAQHYTAAEQYHRAFQYHLQAALLAWQALDIAETTKCLEQLQLLWPQVPALQAGEEILDRPQLADFNPDFPLTQLPVMESSPSYRQVVPENLMGPQYLVLQGNLLILQRDFSQAEQVLTRARQWSAHLQQWELVAQAQLALGELYKERGLFDTASDAFQEAHKRYQQIDYGDGVCQALTRLAWLNFEYANYTPAKSYGQQILQIATQCSDAAREAQAQLILAASNYRTAHYGHATIAAQTALQIAQHQQDRVLERQAYGLLGAISNQIAAYPTALQYLAPALSIAQDTGAVRATAQLWLEMATTYYQQSHYQQAQQYFSQAQEISHQILAKSEQALAFIGLALVYNAQQEPDQATNYLRQAANLASLIPDPVVSVREKLALGHLALNSPDSLKGLALLQSGQELASRHQLRAELWQLLYCRGQLQLKLHQPLVALQSFKESAALVKSISTTIFDEAARKTFLSERKIILQAIKKLS